MELKTIKYINNTKNLPKFSGGEENQSTENDNSVDLKANNFSSRWGNSTYSLAGGAAGALNLAGTINSLQYPTMHAGDYVGKYGMNADNSINGVQYQTYNPIDEKAEEAAMSKERDTGVVQTASLGATAGAGIGMGAGMLAGMSAGGWLGPVGLVGGALIGGVLGGILGNKKKREQERQMIMAQRRQNNFNEQSRSDALTASIQQQQAKQYGDTSGQSLYSAALGKEDINPITKETYSNHVVQGSHGKQVGKQNAWLDDKEWIEDTEDGSFYQVHGNPNKTDSIRGFVKNTDRIAASNILFPGTKLSMADVYPIAKLEGWTDDLFAIQQQIKNNAGINNKTKNNVMTADIGWENIISTIPGIIQSWADYRNIANDTLARTNIQPRNKYELYGSKLMANRRGNIYPIIKQIIANEGAQRYGINASGGLSAGQKQLYNLANSANSRSAIANANIQNQNLNNQYRGEEANFLANMGNQIMNAGTDAEKYNIAMNNSTHNAMVQGLNTSKYNALNYLTQFGKNAWENGIYQNSYNLYSQNVKNETAKTKAIIDSLGINSNRKKSINSTRMPEIFSNEWFDWFRNLPRSRRIESA